MQRVTRGPTRVGATPRHWDQGGERQQAGAEMGHIWLWGSYLGLEKLLCQSVTDD